jgi:hypothetical protein
MEASRSSETSVNFYQTTRRNNPEDSYLHTRSREDLKSHWSILVYARLGYILIYCSSIIKTFV